LNKENFQQFKGTYKFTNIGYSKLYLFADLQGVLYYFILEKSML